MQEPFLTQTMREALEAAMKNRWQDFIKIVRKDKRENMMKSHDLRGNTVFHLGLRSNDPLLIRELLEMLSDSEMLSALTQQNCHGNTLLHEITCFNAKVEMAQAVLLIAKRVLLSLESLFELKNNEGETPLFMAARNGNLKMLQFMVTYVKGTNSNSIHWQSENQPVLHASVIGQHFDVALWLVTMHPELALEKDQNGFTCLQLLSKLPQCFSSHTHMGLVKRLIYNLLPNEGYEIEGGGDPRRDLENGTMDEIMELPKSVISRINYSFWKSFAKGFTSIDHVWERKKKLDFANQLVDLLVELDFSWKKSFNSCNGTMTVKPPKPFNMDKRRWQIESKRLELENDQDSNYTPLLLAASAGISEIIEKILRVYPEAIHHVSEDGHNVLHMAVKHRQKKVFAVIDRKNALESLALQITKSGDTILHQVARMDCYSQATFERTAYDGMEGVAFQLQDELRWFDRLRRIVPSYYRMHQDKLGLTASEVFEIEHGEMLEAAQKWLKKIAQACTVVASLMVMILFAATFAQLGGSDGKSAQDEDKIEAHNLMLKFFYCSNLVPLAFSAPSLLLFLSILTSRSSLWDFHNHLPIKHMLGFALLILSVSTTLLPVAAAVMTNMEQGRHAWSIVSKSVITIVPMPFSLLLFSWLTTWLSRWINR